MSNSLGIATVTSCMRAVLESAFTSQNNVDDSLSNATVTTLLPSAETGLPNPGANVFLFQVTPNAAGRNADLPTRTSQGQIVSRPRVALDLHYLITFYGSDEHLEPQRLLGIAIRTLHRQPVFSPTVVNQAIAQLVASHPDLSFLNRSNLAGAMEPIRLTPSAMTADELARIWSVFSFQTRFSLSLAYQASMLFVDADDAGRLALPVKFTNVYVDAGGPPEVDRVVPLADPTGPIVPGTQLLIVGRGFGTTVSDVEVVVDGTRLVPTSVNQVQITFTLPLTTHAGTRGLQVARPRLMGSPPVPHQGLLSNLTPLLVPPRILSSIITFTFTSPSDPEDDPPPEVVGADTLVSGHLEITVSPAVGQTQNVVVFLNELGVPPGLTARAYTLPVDRRADTADSTLVRVKFLRVVAATYLLRVQVDGVSSALESDPLTGLFVRPFVVVAPP